MHDPVLGQGSRPPFPAKTRVNLKTQWSAVAAAVGGALRLAEGASSSDPFDSFSTDSRLPGNGKAFWALKGARHDAHSFLDAALARNFSGWVVERGRLKPSSPRPPRLLEVPDTLKALQALAAWHRRRFEIPVVGVTGSNGKTTTKEMIKSIALQVGPVCASRANWNNQFGLPFSVLELLEEHRYGIFELADSHPGDIDEIARVARPDVAVITNIGADHLEFYSSARDNFDAKAEILKHLAADGFAVLNADDPWMQSLIVGLGARAITFGRSLTARVRWERPSFLYIDRTRLELRLKGLGEITLANAAAAAAAAVALGLDFDAIRKGLESFTPPPMRLERLQEASGARIVLDAYNANPSSMHAAITAFCEEYPDLKKTLVLGDMKELGASSAKFHGELGRWLATLPLDSVYLAGPEMKSAYAALKNSKPSFRCFWGETPEAWTDALAKNLEAGRALLFKASRAMAFETILVKLRCSFT